MGESRKDGSNSNIVIGDDEAHVSVGIHRRKILPRVPPHVRENNKHIYDPVVLSIGPYHHGNSKFDQLEELKGDVVNIIFGGKDVSVFRRMIMDRIDEIRSFYGGLSRNEYDDEKLGEIVLRDTCFTLYYMEIVVGNTEYDLHCLRHVGASVISFMFRDFVMLENQIPLWGIKVLINLTFDDDRKDKGEALLYNFLSEANFGDSRLKRVPWKNEEDEPLHLLEAHRATLLQDLQELTSRRHWNFKLGWPCRKKGADKRSSFQTANSPFRSVTDLKMKGIYFVPSSNCVKDIKFTSYYFFGKLQLPIWFVTKNSKIYLSNLIALEMSPETYTDTDTDFAGLSYIDFMKSLIHGPKDMRELREKGILFSRLAKDEEVVVMFKELETYGFYNEDLFLRVKMSIDEHCNSKAKTWMAELFHTYFRTPWTVLALIASIFLLILTFLQTSYTINPKKT